MATTTLDPDLFPDPDPTDGAHPSLTLHAPTPADVERVWRDYWAPLFRVKGPDPITATKRELYDYYRLVDQARAVYRHVTGGLCDDLCASAEGIIALADRRVARAVEAAVQVHVQSQREKHAPAGRREGS